MDKIGDTFIKSDKETMSQGRGFMNLHSLELTLQTSAVKQKEALKHRSFLEIFSA